MVSLIKKTSIKIRRQESPFWAFCYSFGKRLMCLSVPCIKPIHSFLYNEWCLRRTAWHAFWRVIYYEPMFKSQCEYVGKHFHMEYAGNGSARIRGNLKLTIGNDVRIFDNTIFVGLKIMDNPRLKIGDNTYIGPLVRFMVADRIDVGSHCLITSRIITDNPGHSIGDVLERMKSGGGSPERESIKPVKIGDFCFLPLDTVVYPGVSVGDGVVARIGTHISRNVPPFCQVAGNPMRIVRKLPIPEEMKTIVGENRYESYLDAHRNLQL